MNIKKIIKSPIFLIFLAWFFLPKILEWLKPSNYFETPLTDIPNTTISKAKAESIAYQLYDTMKYAFSNQTKILELLNEVETEPNFSLVSQKFGLKPYDDSYGGLNPWAPKKNLVFWINKELSQTNLEEVKTMFPTIF